MPYIDRDKIINAKVPYDDELSRYDLGWNDAIDAIAEMPTADVQEMTLENAIDYLHKVGWMQEHDRVLTESAQPDVPERNVGKWVEEIGMLMCSECGDAWGTEQFDEVMSFNYCPNCGAQMRERSEDE